MKILSRYRPCPSIEILILASVRAVIEAVPVNCDPWTPFSVSSGDLSLIDLVVATRDDVEDFTCDVTFQAADRFQLGLTFS